MNTREAIIPPGQEGTYEQFHFAPAFRVGDTVYVSGVIGHGEDGRVPDEAADEFRSAFEQLAATLAAAGAALADIVELTTFHVGMAEIGDFVAAKDAVISKPYPAWTAIGCASLIAPRARVEIKATAVIA
jgi:enamine deaminase RidA (YjgF/YER057c/UK114 family)